MCSEMGFQLNDGKSENPFVGLMETPVSSSSSSSGGKILFYTFLFLMFTFAAATKKIIFAS